MTIRESSFFIGDTGKLRMLNRKRALRILKYTYIIIGRTYSYSSAHVLRLLIACLAELAVRQRAKGEGSPMLRLLYRLSSDGWEARQGG